MGTLQDFKCEPRWKYEVIAKNSCAERHFVTKWIFSPLDAAGGNWNPGNRRVCAGPGIRPCDGEPVG